MSSARDKVRARLEAVCLALGPELLDELTLVGGSTQAVFPLVVPVRPTKDVDFIFRPASPMHWNRLTRALEDKGFRASRDEDAPDCRYVKAAERERLVIDVMPTDDRLGFTNRWYDEAHRYRRATDISHLYAITPVHYLLTKIEAYRGRGSHDPISSHDLEDIITVCRGLPGFLDELQAAQEPAAREACAFLVALAGGPDGEAYLAAHIEGDTVDMSASQLRVRLLKLSSPLIG